MSKQNSGKTVVDIISFALGGLICSLLSVSITVYFINSTGFLLTFSKIVIGLFVFLSVVAVWYLAHRGKLWEVVVGKNLHDAQRELVDSVKALIPGFGGGVVKVTQRDAVQNLMAIYGDMQARRFIVICVLATVGTISALVSAAFLIRQTIVMDKQSGIMEKQSEIALEISQTETLYKPYWDMKHSDSDETRRSTFTTLLAEQQTTNFDGINLKNVQFEPTDGRLTVEGFSCRNCRMNDVEFKNTNWAGDIRIFDSFIVKLTFIQGSIIRPKIYQTTIISDDKDEFGNLTKGNFILAMNVEQFIFQDSKLNNARIHGFPERGLDQFDIESVTKSVFKNVEFHSVRITTNQNIVGAFENATFENVEILDSSIIDVDLSDVRITGALTLENVDLKGVTFSKNQQPCIRFNDTQDTHVSWVSSGKGGCS